MTLPMNPKELENWEEVRRSGKMKYALKTSFIATITCFLLYFLVNGYVHLSEIDKYIAYNVAQGATLGLTLVISFVVLFICGTVLYSINDKRYQFTKQNPPVTEKK